MDAILPQKRSTNSVPAIFLLVLIVGAPVQAQHTITTVAGGGPNNQPALSSSIGEPSNVGRDGAGNFYIADSFSNRIFKVDPGGNLTIVAGNGGNGFSGDGGPATSAELWGPFGMFVDSAGNIFIADDYNSRIREVAAATGIISTIAGSGGQGYCCDGHPATNAELDQPIDVFVDSHGNIFIADTFNNRIREVVAATGVIQTVAGNGTAGYSGDGGPATSAELFDPAGVFVDSAGNIFIADSSNDRVREVVAATGVIKTIAGTGTPGYSGDGGPATSAQLNLGTNGQFPMGRLLVDSAGNVIIVDSYNHRVRKIAAATGVINTIAGTGTPGYSGDGGPAISAELNQPFDMSIDSAGNIFISDTGNSRIREVVAATGVIETIYGNGMLSYSGDSGLATNATLYYPSGVSADSDGNIFIADTGNGRIREVVAATGEIQTVAGNGTGGYSGGDGGPATSAAISPTDVFVDSFGNLFLSDSGSSRIREVAAGTTVIQTVAGNGTAGYSGDGGSATSAELNLSDGFCHQQCGAIFVDGAGNLFISDTGNSRIRKVVAATGVIQTVAGNGTHSYSGDGGPATSAGIEYPQGVFVDSSGNIFFATIGVVSSFPCGGCPDSSRIREVVAATGLIKTVAGNGGFGYGGDGGLATNAGLAAASVFVDGLGNIFIADMFNNRIREVVAATGIIQTVAGSGVSGYSGDGGTAINARLAGPSGLAVDSSGDLLITDSNNHRIRSISQLITISAWSLSPKSLNFGNQLVDASSNAQSATLANNGVAALTISSIAITGSNSGDFSETNTCGTSVAPSSNCQVNVTFKPTATGMRAASLTVTDNATGNAQSVALTGTGTAEAVTLSTTSLTFSGQLISTSTGAQSVSVTNSGSTPLIISSIAISGANSGDFAQTNTCPASSSGLAAGANCTISVTFTPVATGNRSAVIAIADNVSGSPQSVSLTGMGTDFSLTAAVGGNCPAGGSCSTSATVSAGQPATYNLQVSQLSGFSGVVTLSCNGAPGASTCSVSPASVPPSGSANWAFAVTVSNTANVAVLPWPEFPLNPPLPVSRIALPLFLILLMMLFWSKEFPKQRCVAAHLSALAAALLIVLMMSSGCAGRGSSAVNNQPPTNAMLTITGTSGSVKHQLNLSLTVNH